MEGSRTRGDVSGWSSRDWAPELVIRRDDGEATRRRSGFVVSLAV